MTDLPALIARLRGAAKQTPPDNYVATKLRPKDLKALLDAAERGPAHTRPCLPSDGTGIIGDHYAALGCFDCGGSGRVVCK